MLLGSGQERQDDHDDDEAYNKHDEEEAAMKRSAPLCSACIEEHFIEGLSPTLHKGNLCGKATDSSPCFPV